MQEKKTIYRKKLLTKSFKYKLLMFISLYYLLMSSFRHYSVFPNIGYPSHCINGSKS